VSDELNEIPIRADSVKQNLQQLETLGILIPRKFLRTNSVIT
ncbi:unnamed protein product, partial [Heterotrigona itama]